MQIAFPINCCQRHNFNFPFLLGSPRPCSYTSTPVARLRLCHRSTRAFLCLISDSSPNRPLAPARSHHRRFPLTLAAFDHARCHLRAPAKRASPRLYCTNLVGHREHLVVFLEAVALQRWGRALDRPKDSVASLGETSAENSAKVADQQAVWNTLLELYLVLASAARDRARSARQGTPSLACGRAPAVRTR